MSISSHCLPPSSSLPTVRSLRSATEEQVANALHNLQALYCPLRLRVTLPKAKGTASILIDSGYVSEDNDEVTHDYSGVDNEDPLAILRADDFERSFAVRWLTSFIARANELPFGTDDSRAQLIDDAAFILSSFSDASNDDADESLTRDFSFPTSSSSTIDVRLNDAPLSGTDHTDVGLQSWGASIIYSGLLCTSPERFGLDCLPARSRILELGAGTGLISLTLAKLLPHLAISDTRIFATDYHPTVLENLRANIATNLPNSSMDTEESPVQAMLLDWSAPPASLDSSANTLFAADVVYAPEHAIWLRDCAARLLVPGGIFWLVVTVRKDGKFEGIPDTAEAAFRAGGCPQKDGRVLKIVEREMLAKRKGIGRGDESGYMLFKIEWV